MIKVYSRRQLMAFKPYNAEIEYLESTGTQWIDTLYSVQSFNFSFEINYMQTADNSGIKFLMQQVMNYSNFYIAIYSNASNMLSGAWGGDWKASSVSSDRNRHTVKLQSQKLYRDGAQVLTFSKQTFHTSSNTVSIFDIPARVYWAKITYNGTLVRDLIPVRVGNVGYMYDRVSGQLFGNSGTGSFVLGPDKH